MTARKKKPGHLRLYSRRLCKVRGQRRGPQNEVSDSALRGVLPQPVYLGSHLPGLGGRDPRQPETRTPPVRASQIPQPMWKGMKSCRGGSLLLFPTSYSKEKHTLSPQVNSTAERQILVFVHKPWRKNKDRKHTLSDSRPSSP